MASLSRLLGSLGPDCDFCIVRDPAPPHVWSRKQWAGGVDDRTHALFLDDDVILCEKFWATLSNAVAARAGDIVALHCNHPRAIEVYNKGFRWMTSVDGLVGCGYVMPQGLLREFIDFERDEMQAWARETPPGNPHHLACDTAVSLFAMATGRLIHHTVPALLDHDTSVPSCYGNDGHNQRRPAVLPQGDMTGIDWNTEALHVGRVYQGNHWRLISELKRPRPLIAYRLEQEPWRA